MGATSCEDCASRAGRVHIDGAPLCDRCADRRVAGLTDMPELGEPPAPVVVTGPDGRVRRLRVRQWRAPTGIVVDLEEVGVAPGEGVEASVLGAHAPGRPR